jgi:protein O-GlcNAc transferase
LQRPADDIFQQAIASFQAGKLADAERSFKEVLRHVPHHIGALNLFGILLMHVRRFEEAEQYVRAALAVDTRSDVTLYNYGTILKNLNRPEEALTRFTQALAINATVPDTWNNRGTVLNDLKRYDEALDDFTKAISLKPDYAEAFYNRGNSLANTGRHEEASASYHRAVAIDPNLETAWLALGNVCFRLKRNAEALVAYDKAVAIRPDHEGAWLGRGNVCSDLKRYQEAFAAYEKALAIRPDLAEAWLGIGNACSELKRSTEAFAAYDKALAIAPELEGTWVGKGNLYADIKRYEAAAAAYDKALAINPDLAEAWLGRGNLYASLKRHEEALASLDKALALKPDLAAAWLSRGNAFFELARYEDACAAFDNALAGKPDLAEAWLGRGNVCSSLKRYEQAFAAYDKALALKPDLAGAWIGRGNVFFELGRCEEAYAAYDKALAIKPDLAEAWLGRANVCSSLKRYEQAFAAYDKALALKPDFADALVSRASAHFELRQFQEAFSDYDKSFRLNPTLRYAEGNRLHMKMYLCDWTDFEAECSRLLSTVTNGTAVSQPFSILAIPSSSADQLRCAERHVADRYGGDFGPLWRGERYAHDRIRLAYVSSDFHEHATPYLIAGLFEEHDRTRFEVTGLSFGPDQDSAMRKRLRESFDRFVDARVQDDASIAQLIRELEIDIAIDLKGFTQGARPNVFARRPSPIQAGYLGFPSTTGSGFVDYIIADRFVIPADEQRFFSEKVVYLPDSYQVNDSKRRIAGSVPTRADANLPAEAFVFCSFNSNYKITPDVFDVWMRLLQAVEGSVLWLLEGSPIASNNLRKEAEVRGVAAERIVIATQAKLEDHLARHTLADLFVDTRYCNAHTTASDALWAGLPVITCVGPAFAGRVAASLLHAVGLPELVTRSLADYEALALNLARDPASLASLRARLARNRVTSSLFDTQRFTRHIEAAYIAMWERYQRGAPPESFAVEPIG